MHVTGICIKIVIIGIFLRKWHMFLSRLHQTCSRVADIRRRVPCTPWSTPYTSGLRVLVPCALPLLSFLSTDWRNPSTHVEVKRHLSIFKTTPWKQRKTLEGFQVSCTFRVGHSPGSQNKQCYEKQAQQHMCQSSENLSLRTSSSCSPISLCTHSTRI